MVGASGVRDMKGGRFRMVVLTAKASYQFGQTRVYWYNPM